MSSNQSNGPKWRTKTGEVINVSDMTNVHIQNSLNYLRKQKRLDAKSMSVLSVEITKREERQFKDFLKQKRKCNYCDGGVCSIEEINKDDYMFSLGYVFKCDLCSYTSGYIARPKGIFENPPKYDECHAVNIQRFSEYFTQDEDYFEQNF